MTAHRRSRARRPFDPTPFRELFVTLAQLRAASADALQTLVPHAEGYGRSQRALHRALARLVDAGFLRRIRIEGARRLYLLTRASLGVLTEMGWAAPETLRRVPSDEIARFLWLRAAMHAALKREGFSVGRDSCAAFAFRRFRLDEAFDGDKKLHDRAKEVVRRDRALQPPTTVVCGCGFPHVGNVIPCPRCKTLPPTQFVGAAYACVACKQLVRGPGEHAALGGKAGAVCSGPVAVYELLSYDVAWRLLPENRFDVRLLLVDHPGASLHAQLTALPLNIPGLPVVPIVLRTSDPDSRYDRHRHAWASTGRRHRQLLRAFSSSGLRGVFPFHQTARVIDFAPDLQHRYVIGGPALRPWDALALPVEPADLRKGTKGQRREAPANRHRDRAPARMR